VTDIDLAAIRARAEARYYLYDTLDVDFLLALVDAKVARIDKALALCDLHLDADAARIISRALTEDVPQ
jgi:hypothetical protein